MTTATPTIDEQRKQLEAERRRLAPEAQQGDAAARKRVATIGEELRRLADEAELSALASQERQRRTAEERQRERAEERAAWESERRERTAARARRLERIATLGAELEALIVEETPNSSALDVLEQSLTGRFPLVPSPVQTRTAIAERLRGPLDTAGLRLVSGG